MNSITVRNLTPEEIREFGFDEPNAVNWGVIKDNNPVAYFSAEPVTKDGILEVHVTAKRRELHPKLLRFYALTFSNRLLELGAPGLIAKIKIRNRASVGVAKAAGFIETSRDDDFIVLVKNVKTENPAAPV